MLISLVDNKKKESREIDGPLECVQEALEEIDGKSLIYLASRNPKFIIYPPLSKKVDLDDKDVIFDVDYSDKEKPKFSTGNIMGFMSLKNDVRINITSRFDSGDKNYFLHYMLQKICNVAYTPRTHSGEESFFDFLYYLFPAYLNVAMKQGIYRAYVTREYNDANVRGPIDVARHIRCNIPFNGKIAYHTREYTTDNFVTQLIRHTIEYIRSLSFGDSVLNGSLISDSVDNVKLIESATSSYNRNARQQIISKNLRPITHPYYTAYEPLRKLCLAILMHKKLSYGEDSTNQINGILFDGASLWEEYLNRVLKKGLKVDLKHPNNRTHEGAQYLFKNDDNQNRRWIFPDFMIGCDTAKGQVDSAEAIIDAKYKILDGGIDRDDSFQMLAYLSRFKSKQGFLIHPVKKDEGTQEPKIMTLYNDDSVKLTVVPFVVPETNGKFEEFRAAMEESEKKMVAHLPFEKK
ncbi:hypothetical protein IKQ19_08280 [Candidatus Saccharibacteria bacterium]|nr:hypothetical protein [Candidatus Saccharibacteria bacterium]